jgi:hypothetical protein
MFNVTPCFANIKCIVTQPLNIFLFSLYFQNSTINSSLEMFRLSSSFSATSLESPSSPGAADATGVSEDTELLQEEPEEGERGGGGRVTDGRGDGEGGGGVVGTVGEEEEESQKS